jgi:hypothetical protein
VSSSMPGVDSSTQSVTGVGYTPAMPIKAPAHGTYGGIPVSMQPGILAFVSGTVTYNIEVTGDDVLAPSYVESAGNWQPISTAMTGLTASAVNTLGAVVTAIRGRITAGTGTLTIQFIQFTG